MPRRRFKPPVLGRLAWAWLGFAAGAVLLGAYALALGAKIDAPTRVALPVGALERMAPPQTVSVLNAAESQSRPALREGDDPDAAHAGELFAQSPVEILRQPSDDPYADDSADAPLAFDERDIVITIDGKPAAPPSAQPATAAALARPAFRIPDPDPALLAATAFGQRPKISADGRRAARHYARPFASDAGAPRAALIVAGLGLNRALTERAIDELPPEITLAFAPYAKDLDYWTARAREAGHEIMIELPMETRAGADALGPAALSTERTQAENLQRLDWLMSRFGGYFGATNYLGGKFSADREAIRPVLTRLAQAGVAYVDDTGATRALGLDGGPVAVVDRMIAAGTLGEDVGAARRDLRALAAVAERNGHALGKAYAYDAVIDAVIEWSEALAADGIALAPASAVVHARAGAL
ncbi:divergent polysaccharide deacetylase family protein [Amphiplicatus metriothermophilus]|uniref:Divergent polysaccharide deacetylase n=1 Tax=Amphiplicatus metriothermophilus TaxID=1519374 RepID=A0A239PJ19_9PROT|nr:divergent polysaccharide deacetylase family protein [Amphiplicatus metriothermophilus]MBB5517898.1 hypothetical protein [Amphiplicatus metriothermophilus]SNT67768.1 hypothetical protein SAMN06297382_0261 [Amphiplicatus metriothermophilus]